MKQLTDNDIIEKKFTVGDYVYLKMQLYLQSSMALRRNFKLNL